MLPRRPSHNHLHMRGPTGRAFDNSGLFDSVYALKSFTNLSVKTLGVRTPFNPKTRRMAHLQNQDIDRFETGVGSHVCGSPGRCAVKRDGGKPGLAINQNISENFVAFHMMIAFPALIYI